MDGGGPGLLNSNILLTKNNTQRPLAKKMKIDNEISEFKGFATKLEELLNYSKNLDGSSKKFCIDFAIRNFLILDPLCTQNVMSNLQYLSNDLIDNHNSYPTTTQTNTNCTNNTTKIIEQKKQQFISI